MAFERNTITNFYFDQRDFSVLGYLPRYSLIKGCKSDMGLLSSRFSCLLPLSGDVLFFIIMPFLQIFL